MVSGQGGLFYIKQDATGGRTLSFHAIYKFMDTYTEDTSANKVNVFAYDVYDSSNIIVSYLGSF